MKIAIIGSGNIGGTLAKALDKAGHHIIIGTRDTANGDVIQLLQHGQHISANTIQKAVSESEVIIIAVPLPAIPDVAESIGNIEGKIVIETSNAFGKPLQKYIYGTTALKEITKNHKVVKCFNTIGAEDLANPQFGELKADAFVAGEDKKAKEVAQRLALDIGFGQCYDLGGDEALPLLENLAVTWGALAYKAGLGRRAAFKILTDEKKK